MVAGSTRTATKRLVLRFKQLNQYQKDQVLRAATPAERKLFTGIGVKPAASSLPSYGITPKDLGLSPSDLR